jgi:5-methylcytosine-specific restriction endonuclease McrA
MKLRLPPEEYAALCSSILRRDKYKCRSCGSRNNLHVHHIWFRSNQGPDEPWNLVALCSACHDGVHKNVQHGVYGLVITIDAVSGEVKMVRNWGWKPQ